MPVTHGLPIDRNPPADMQRRVASADTPTARSLRRARWMALAQRGDAGAYRALLDDLGPLLVRYLRRRVRDRQEDRKSVV